MEMANKTQSASEIVTPKTDLVFRKLFGTEENKDILQSFLSAVLKMPAEENHLLQRSFDQRAVGSR